MVVVAVVLYVVLVVAFALRMWTGRRILAVSVLAGLVVGAVTGWMIGLALGPGPETGPMYGIQQVASGVIGATEGLVVGPIVLGAFGWVVSGWSARRRPARTSLGGH